MWWIMLLTMTLRSVASMTTTPCEEARFRCAQREGCGNALHTYMSGCSAVLRGMVISRCPDVCKNALIALTSTEEGKALMTCDCNDEYCEDTKQRVEVCRQQVMIAHHDDTIVTCDVARMICQADPACSAAFDYYENYCKSMFTGRKCTKRCKNSLYILQRQIKAQKLKNCVCDGPNIMECLRAQHNREKLCIRKPNKPKGNNGNKEEKRKEQHHHSKHHDDNKGSRGGHKSDHNGDHRVHNKIHHMHGNVTSNNNNNKEVAVHVTEPVVRGDVFTNDIKTFRTGNYATTLRMSYVLVTLFSVIVWCAS
ncbi:growth arrest-specific protein 1-like [Onthophagus taurus]|uniref:growth arrest-specific protein 1-like n=1 Tax=Onthophagus taurus TaxID=166361 RepID=UPI000C20BD09|nr:growth arrest-specific protein 1-like [Onthophagus taurus]